MELANWPPSRGPDNPHEPADEQFILGKITRRDMEPPPCPELTIQQEAEVQEVAQEFLDDVSGENPDLEFGTPTALVLVDR